MTTDKIYPHWKEEEIKDHIDLPSFQGIDIRFSFKQRSKGMYNTVNVWTLPSSVHHLSWHCTVQQYAPKVVLISW